ncbi:50S ribosomal protein L20 [Candidatus Uhrbacteria bacterium]|nr:50S ribosomal protein L20 [Candidatus Uhrbacteria bacterium]
MPRVKRGTIHLKKRRTLFKAVKGYKWGRKNKIRLARPAMLKAGAYAYRDRRTKKRVRRNLWQIKINAAVRMHGLSYSKFIKLLKDAHVELDRKIIATLAEKYPTMFQKIVEKVKK